MSATEESAQKGGVSLLDDIIAFRDECRAAQRDLIPASDPTGDARLAFHAVADQLDALIKRHGGG